MSHLKFLNFFLPVRADFETRCDVRTENPPPALLFEASIHGCVTFTTPRPKCDIRLATAHRLLLRSSM